MMLAYCRMPYEDELYYGYMHDLFLWNVNTNLKGMDAAIGGYVRVLNPSCLSNVCMSIENATFPSLARLVSMTALGCLMDGLDGKKASKLCEGMIQPEEAGVPIQNKTGVTDAEDIRICPECWAEDSEKYGAGYLHLSHNLPGVTCCAKHGVPLLSSPRPDKSSKLLPYDPADFTPIEVGNVQAGTDMARLQKKLNKRKLMELSVVTCPVCGREYAAHLYSEQSGCGCPFCNMGRSFMENINRRLDVLYHGEYRVLDPSGNRSRMNAVHVPCGTGTVRVFELIYAYDKAPRCGECVKLEPERLQARYDPEGKEWQFLTNPERATKPYKIHVKHLPCGHEYFINVQNFAGHEGGYCSVCWNSRRTLDAGSIDPDYEILGEYAGCREAVKILHKGCGLPFEATRTAFLTGRRCPLCYAKLTFADVEEAVEECAPGWKVVKSDTRSCAHPVTEHGYVYPKMPYKKIIRDLTRDDPEIFTDRVKRYEGKVNAKKQLYDRIAAEAVDGIWDIKDGLGGKRVTVKEAKGAECICGMGYFEHVGDGVYRVKSREEMLKE
ncbi:MAG: TniQ family protein [Clostridiales bacterium]|nr:TniQ family protein [Clostridiales bacterium]